MKKKFGKLLISILSVMIALIIAYIIDIPLKKTFNSPLSFMKDEFVPTICLSDIEDVSDIKIYEEANPDKNTVTYKSSVLIPHFVSVCQWQISEIITWPESGRNYGSWVYTYYYEMRFEYLRSRIIHGDILRKNDYIKTFCKKRDIKTLEDDRFDLLYKISEIEEKNANWSCLIAAKGKKVFCVMYYGMVGNDVLLDKMAEVLNYEGEFSMDIES